MENMQEATGDIQQPAPRARKVVRVGGVEEFSDEARGRLFGARNGDQELGSRGNFSVPAAFTPELLEALS